MVIDLDGHFVTARQLPKMVQVSKKSWQTSVSFISSDGNNELFNADYDYDYTRIAKSAGNYRWNHHHRDKTERERERL